MRKYNKYPVYKDSSAQWIGSIPKEWQALRIGSMFRERREKVSDKDFKPLSVTKKGIVPQLDNAAKSNDGDNRKGVRKGDFVINSRSDRKGSSGIAYEDGSVSLINIVMEPHGIVSEFAEYLLKSNNFIEEFYRYGHGIVADLWTTRFSDMKGILIPVPSEPEQTAIANFLDKKTAEIKEFIRLKEKTIELLKERKTAIINQAVTKGLNPNVPMRDSGIEWLGEIPKHWEVKKLKYCLKNITGGGTPSMENSNYWSGTIPWISPKDMKSYVIVESKMHITEMALRNTNVSILPIGSLLLVVRSGILQRTLPVCRTGVEATINQDLKALVPISNINSEYLYHLLKGCEGAVLYECVKAIATVESIEMDYLKNFKLPFAPIDEQGSIVEFINDQTIRFDQSISQAQQEIALIKEYQQSLISEAVTGKIDVRELL